MEIVNCNEFDVPPELETVTSAGLGTTVSEARIVAVT